MRPLIERKNVGLIPKPPKGKVAERLKASGC